MSRKLIKKCEEIEGGALGREGQQRDFVATRRTYKFKR